MNRIKNISKSFHLGLQRIGFENDDALFMTSNDFDLPDPQIKFHIENAKEFNASAVYLRKQLNGSYKAQVFLFDFTDRDFVDQNESEITEIQKKIWSSGEAPLACVFYNTEIKILDCTKHITKKYKPEYLIRSLKLTGKVHELYNEHFALKIKSGIFWEQLELKDKFRFQNSAYDKLIENIRFVINKLSNELKEASHEIINKIIIQSILIKYLEERIDSEGNKLLSERYFQKYNNANSFNDVLKRGNFVDLLNDLNNNFNGNVFKWTEKEQDQLKILDLSLVADLLATDKTNLNSEQLELGFPDWRYFEFKFIPVELISRLYEEFLGENKKDKGLFYTPSHLAKLLVDESLPLKKYKDVNLKEFTILDPACGSGIFLVVVFKRLVQIWRLQNEMKFPDINDLKPLLKNIFGVDKEEQAIRLASFSLSLALCNELNPIKIINELKFDDLREENLIQFDFFNCQEIRKKRFDLIIGNPPFLIGAIDNYDKYWEVNGEKIKIPQGQIALKFLTESLQVLKEKGVVCLIIKSSGLLYNTTSNNYKKALFSYFNVVQIFDFTALARNKSLWDNGADVASAAVFIKNEKPDQNKNILHLTFRRTKATKERIVFELDDYDLHFVNRNSAINNEFIWKNNLLGGGRIKNIVEKASLSENFEDFLETNDIVYGEGFKVGSKGHLNPDFIYDLKTLPTEAINEDSIFIESLTKISKSQKFEKIPDKLVFKAPNILIKENIGKSRIPIHLNLSDFSFQHKIIGISAPIKTLSKIIELFKVQNDLYRFLIFVNSGQVLVNLNTAILKRDIMNLPFTKISLSEFDVNIISDINTYMQDFIRHGEMSIAQRLIKQDKIKPILIKYGAEFSKALNIIYENKEFRFRLSDIVELENSLLATVFKYDSCDDSVNVHKNFSKLNIKGLTYKEISNQLSINRIIKLYPQENTVVFIKPNQYRYWLSHTAYRDADKCFSDFSKLIE